jgi:hypothetical protein
LTGHEPCKWSEDKKECALLIIFVAVTHAFGSFGVVMICLEIVS